MAWLLMSTTGFTTCVCVYVRVIVIDYMRAMVTLSGGFVTHRSLMFLQEAERYRRELTDPSKQLSLDSILNVFKQDLIRRNLYKAPLPEGKSRHFHSFQRSERS